MTIRSTRDLLFSYYRNLKIFVALAAFALIFTYGCSWWAMYILGSLNPADRFPWALDILGLILLATDGIFFLTLAYKTAQCSIVISFFDMVGTEDEILEKISEFRRRKDVVADYLTGKRLASDMPRLEKDEEREEPDVIEFLEDSPTIENALFQCLEIPPKDQTGDWIVDVLGGGFIAIAMAVIYLDCSRYLYREGRMVETGYHSKGITMESPLEAVFVMLAFWLTALINVCVSGKLNVEKIIIDKGWNDKETMIKLLKLCRVSYPEDLELPCGLEFKE